MDKLFLKILEDNKIFDHLNNLLIERNNLLLTGLNESSQSNILYETFNSINRNLVVIVKDSKKAIALEDDLRFFTDDVIYFPAKEIVFFDSYAHSNDLRNRRIKALSDIKDGKKRIIVTTIESFLVKMIHEDLWYDAYQSIDESSIIDLESFTKRLVELGYERNEMVQAKGHFSVRGGIIDIFPITSEVPYRIELFGDEIDSIRCFDLTTQRTIEEVNGFSFGPCREILLNESSKEKLIKYFSEAIKENKVQKNKIEDYHEYIEMLEQDIYIDGLNNYFSIIYKESSSLLDYFKDPLVTILSPNILSEKAHFFIEDMKQRFTTYLENQEVLKEQFDIFYKFVDFKKTLEKNQYFLIDDLQKRIMDFEYENLIAFETKEVPRYFKKLDELAIDVKRWKNKNYKIIIVLETDEKIETVNSFLIENNIFPKINSKTIKSCEIVLKKGLLKDGYILESAKTIVVTEHELFGVRKFKKSKFSSDKSKIIKNYDELSENDLVVHEAHGIGKFMGIHKLNIMNNDNDYFKIQYADSGVLYIPVNQMDLIQKYIGKKKKTVRLSDLNSDQWKKKKAKVQKAIEEMTDELIELYSKRRKSKGFKFDKDGIWQKEFEALFPYEETEDQLICIKEIKEDMEKETPMERLLCGDVGYGKTEVAIRAIFKAVNNGKQVVFLVPTTILAQQHYNNLKERFEKYPINVDVLSRFKTRKQQNDIVDRVRKGYVDIIIGTHRILSNDVVFKDLGLLVIDEEQRFGVKDKEKIKFMKENVDILTLTATPIPRTLHMSLIGIRDMSVIEDPPENRYPIQTYVTEFDEVLVREAILREVSRSGQVYFVHNRVKDIDDFTHKIKKMLPNLRIRFAHGQMSNRKLEKIMMDFLDYEFDVLISTTIIETGLDIPRVNTILINDADYFGLSQLYQLRGRVGRSDKIAYAYLLYKKDKVLSEVAEKRLKAIKNFTELGAGFKIAMRDLEIRGAGNLLGVSQHGDMDAIGYELYTKLLEESIKKAKGEPIKESIEANISLNVNAYIPESYISHVNHKLEMYKKVSLIETEDEVIDLQMEFIDRFGDLPKSVVALIDIAYLKVMLEKLNISEVVDKGSAIGFYFTDDGSFDLDILSMLMIEYKRKVRVPDQFKPYFEYSFRNRDITEYEKLQEINNMIKKVYKAFK